MEEDLLKENVPGRWSKLDRAVESSDKRLEHDSDFSASEDDDNYDPTIDDILAKQQDDSQGDYIFSKKINDADIPDQVRHSILSERGRRHATGIKGVLADYKASKAFKSAQREANEEKKQQILRRMVEGYKIPLGQAAEAVDPAARRGRGRRDSGSEEGDEDSGDDDDAFMRDYRARRLQELQRESTLPSFGSCAEIGSGDFLREVEQADPRVFVVVHLYESSVQGSIRMNRILEELALKMPHIKFLRLHASRNSIEVDIVTLPILSIYRGGETVNSIVGVTHEFGDYFTAEDVQWLLEAHTVP